MPADLQRCFIALRPHPSSRDRLASLPVAQAAHRVAADDLHLTLAFIGAITQVQSQALGDALPSMAKALPDLRFRHIEHWPVQARSRVVVATFDLCDELTEVAQRLRALLHAMHLPVDSRPLRPHVTLARFSNSSGYEEAPSPDGDAFEARFDALVLYSSSQASQGPRYKPLAVCAIA